MENVPLVSVLLLSMNHEQFIEQCINSLTNQTYKNMEILYLDNASADNTYEVGKSLLAKSGLTFKTFKNSESRGISKNLNFLLSHAKGEFISPLSTDDWLTDDSIEEKVKYFKSSPHFGMVYSSCYHFNYDTKTYLISPKKPEFKEGWILQDILIKNIISTTGYMVKKNVLFTVGGFDEKSNIEDWDVFIRIAEKFPIGCIQKELAYYGTQKKINISRDIAYMYSGYDYLIKKYNNYPDFSRTKERLVKSKVYNLATYSPGFKTICFILKNFRFNLFYCKQIVKAILYLINHKLIAPSVKTYTP